MAQRDPVSIIVLTHGALDYTKACVDALYKTTENFELVVVDNASPDDTPGYLTTLAEERDNVKVVLNDSNTGYAAGCNRGVAEASHDLLCLLNNDTVPSPGWLEALVAALEPGVGAVGAKLVYPNGNIQHAGIDFMYQAQPMPHFVPYHRNINEPGSTPAANVKRDMPGVTAACLLTSRTIWDEVGGMDEGYIVANYEDVDFNLKIRDAGYRVVYEPAACLVHHHGTTIKNKPDAPDHPGRYMQQNFLRLQERWFQKLLAGLAGVKR